MENINISCVTREGIGNNLISKDVKVGKTFLLSCLPLIGMLESAEHLFLVNKLFENGTMTRCKYMMKMQAMLSE